MKKKVCDSKIEISDVGIPDTPPPPPPPPPTSLKCLKFLIHHPTPSWGRHKSMTL